MYLSSLPGLRFDPHITFMTGNDRFNDSEAQSVPGILRGIPSSVEALKEMRLVFEWDPHPGVADDQATLGFKSLELY